MLGFAFLAPVKMTWLILDPGADGGRPIEYEVIACANPTDLTCSNAGDFKSLAKGVHDGGELSLTFRPGLTLLDDGPLLAEVVSQDTFRGLGGIRMPIVLHLKAGAEEIYAKKLMVFSCQFFPEMKQNVSPVLPGVTLDGVEWGQSDRPVRSRPTDGGVVVKPLFFDDLQEPYVVPSFQLRPLKLVEAWKISYYADVGRFSPGDTGGVGFDGELGRHVTEWTPTSADQTERDVNFWFVVRDGRGGQTWLTRTLHYQP
jgi:hypothetical protein